MQVTSKVLSRHFLSKNQRLNYDDVKKPPTSVGGLKEKLKTYVLIAKEQKHTMRKECRRSA
ncbi:hypothetical protein VCHA56P521_210076 [Vibrio chagasii]|nr:hypothetical protein VCHA36P168_160099 [Vibrio chagasii]CAH7059919.1 hypothetical protein VCHA52P461_170002 [Vibrio chagasii]CAH7316099.1 hypothetical protein VCHA37P203_210079 [Vibrio chagasii]CAH7333823.1 hypothetical protein VCHA56P521_210076 [Vibrio chagasii]